MIRLFVDGQHAGLLSGPGARCRLTLEAFAGDGERPAYRVTFPAKEARIVTSEDGARLRRVLLLDDWKPDEDGPEARPLVDLVTVANLVNLDKSAEDLAEEMWRELNKDPDMAAALAKVCGARRLA
ncbi:MAG: hypothetical protein KAQ88_04100 [Hyphomicrobiaceae bacterium]|nr:hypothetical protein [Hyphomicrobiaceae bacterium]